MACHLAGACPHEFLDVTPWAEAAFEHFVRNPLGQRLPRKFKINFSGCSTDCGQAMFNDVGVIAVTRTLPDGSSETGFRIYIAGGLGANPHPALALEEFTSREDLLPTIEAVLRVFDQTGNRDNKLRARLKWVVDTLGIDELRRRVLKIRHTLPASSSWPGGIPAIVEKAGDAPAGFASSGEVTPVGQGVPVQLLPSDPYRKWVATSVVRGRANGSVSAVAYAALGDITAAQFRSLASIQRELGADVRLSNRQNVVFRGLTEAQLPVLYARLEAIGMARPGAELARDVVACPGADTCNIAVTQSRGLAKAIGEALEEEGLAEVGGVRINISGCTNSCGQHHIADIGFFGAERRAHGRSAPGYQMLLGGYVGQEQIHFGDKALRLPAKNAPQAAAAVVRRFAEERQAGEAFRAWMDRVGGAKEIAKGLAAPRRLPVARGAPRVLRRLRRDRPVRRRHRRVGVRGLSRIARCRQRPRSTRRTPTTRPSSSSAVTSCRSRSPTVGSPSAGSSSCAPARPPSRRAAASRHAPTTCAGGRCRGASYPEGRAGYLRWRRDQKARHAGDVADILVGAGYGDGGDRARPGAAAPRATRHRPGHAGRSEDAACLSFIETQLADARRPARARPPRSR